MLRPIIGAIVQNLGYPYVESNGYTAEPLLLNTLFSIIQPPNQLFQFHLSLLC